MDFRRINASKNLKMLLKNKEFRRSFGMVQTPSRESIHHVISTWGHEERYPSNAIRNVQTHIDLKTHEEFKAGIKELVGYIEKRVGMTTKYALIVPMFHGKEVKSQHWIIGPVLDGLRKRSVRPPIAIVQTDVIQDVRRALENDVSMFISVDDAAYSGMQMAEDFLWLVSTIDTLSKTIRVPHHVYIILATVYSSEEAQQYLAKAYKDFLSTRSSLHKTIYMPTTYTAFEIGTQIHHALNSALYHLRNANLGTGYHGRTLLSHKTPNLQSFFSRSLGNAFGKVIRTPYSKEHIGKKRKKPAS